MKNLLYFTVCAMLAVTLSACTSSESQDYVSQIQYNLRVEGKTDGCVSLLWNNGHWELKGDAYTEFSICSDSLQAFEDEHIPITKALQSKDSREVEFGQRVAQDLNSIQLASTEGHYCVIIEGYARDPQTGLSVQIHKVFNN